MYDAVLMDLVMPRLDGAGAAGELRERGYEGAIVGATGRADEEARRAFLDAGGSQVRLVHDAMGSASTSSAPCLTVLAACARRCW